MSDQEEKLKLIEKDLKNKSSEIEKSEKLLSDKEESVNSKLNIISKDELFLSVTKSVNDVFSVYEASMGTTEGCKEMVTNLIEVKCQISNQFVTTEPNKLIRKS